MNPEIEGKLLNLQRCHEKQMKATSIVLANNHHEYTAHARLPSYRKQAPNRQTDDNADSIMESPKRRPTRSISEKKVSQNLSPGENDVNRIIRSVAEEAGSSRITKSPVKNDSKTISRPKESAAVTDLVKGNITASNTEIDEVDHHSSVTIKRDNEKKKQMQVKLMIKYFKLKHNFEIICYFAIIHYQTFCDFIYR